MSQIKNRYRSNNYNRKYSFTLDAILFIILLFIGIALVFFGLVFVFDGFDCV
jgi:hypothetical protein